MKKPDHINELENFTGSPDDARVKVRTVQLLWGEISRSTVWRLIKANKIPKPEKIGGGINTWRVGDLREALKKLGVQQ